MPARSQAQQRFMGMVHAEKEGTLDKSKLDPEFAAKIERVAASIKAKQARDFAETKHKGLPKKVKKKGMKKKGAADVYPKEISRTPAPHLFYKGLMRRLGFSDWGSDARRTKGLGALVERIVPFGKSGRHWDPKSHENMSKVPGPKGWWQRTMPGGKSGFQLEKNSASTAYLKWLARALKYSGKGQPIKAVHGVKKIIKTKPTTKYVELPTTSVDDALRKIHNPKGFSVTKMGGGHYDAFLGKNKIGTMSVNPSTKLVDDVKILKDFRRKGWGTRLYEGVLGHEGMLIRNPETVSPGALRIWEKLSLKFPPSPGSGGVLWRQPGKNLHKIGSVAEDTHPYDGLDAKRQADLAKIHYSKLDKTKPVKTKYIKDTHKLDFIEDVEKNPDFSIKPQEVFRMHYGQDNKILDLDTFNRDILEPARKLKAKYPTHNQYVSGPMKDYYKSKGGYVSDNKLQQLTHPSYEPSQMLDDKTLNKYVGVKVVPSPDKKNYLDTGGLKHTGGLSTRGGTSLALGLEGFDPSFTKRRVTLPHEILHSTQDPRKPIKQPGKGTWSERPQEMQAGSAHIKREYYRATGNVAKDPDSASEAVKWYQQKMNESGNRYSPEFQRHPRAKEWLDAPGTRKTIEAYMPFVVDNSKSPKIKKPKGKFIDHEVKYASDSKAWDSAKVGLMGTSSIVLPMVPLHSISAAKNAPKGQGGKAVTGATIGGYVGHIPSLAYAGYKIRKALKTKDKVVPPSRRLRGVSHQPRRTQFDKRFEKRYQKRFNQSRAGKLSKIYHKLKANLTKGDLKRMLYSNVIGQGIGAGIGYNLSTDYKTKSKKSK